MGSHSVTFHTTQVNSPRLTPARQAGTRFTYPEGWKAELTGDLLHTEMVYPPADGQSVTHPSTNWAQCRLTTLIKLNALTTTLRTPPPKVSKKNMIWEIIHAFNR